MKLNKTSKSQKVAAVILSAIVASAVFLAVFLGASFVTMLLVGALHASVPAVPAVSYFGAMWLVILGMWFRALFASGTKAK